MNSEKRPPPSLPLAIGCSALLMIASVAIVFIGLVQLEGAGMGIGVGILLYGAMAAILVLLAVLIAGIAVFRALWARCKRNVESTGVSDQQSFRGFSAILLGMSISGKSYKEEGGGE